MIRIHKPSNAPMTLATVGRLERDRICMTGGVSESSTIVFKSSIYAADDVKTALINSQYGKCCFCERKIFGDGDVEHFRPKAAVSQSSRTRPATPGYYWLAYDWSNLLLCCSPCNSRHKRNLFPLANPKSRVRSHEKAAAILSEEPHFINPASEDPGEFIRFTGPVPFAINDNIRGRETITALALDRDALVKVRRDYLNLLQQVRGALLLAEKHTDDADWHAEAIILRKILADSQQDNAEFAAMSRSAAALDFRAD